MDKNFYIDQFSKSKIRTLPLTEDGKEIATLRISYKDYEISLKMPCQNGDVPHVYLEDAKFALANLADWLDLVVSKKYINFETDDLCWIEIFDDGIELCFVGSKVNGDIGVFFEKDSKGEWKLEGYC